MNKNKYWNQKTAAILTCFLVFMYPTAHSQSTIKLQKGDAPFFIDQNASGTFIVSAHNKAGNASGGTWSFIKTEPTGKKKWETKVDIRDPRAYELGDVYRYMIASSPDGNYNYLVLTGLRDYYAHQFDINGKHKVVEPLKSFSSNKFSVDGLYCTNKELIYLIRPLSSYQMVFLVRMDHKTGKSKVSKIELKGPNFLVGVNTGANWSASKKIIDNNILLFKYKRKNKETKVEMCTINLSTSTINTASFQVETFGDNKPIFITTTNGLTMLEYDKASVRYTFASTEGKVLVSKEIATDGISKLSGKYNPPIAGGTLLDKTTVAYILEHMQNVYALVIDIESGQVLTKGLSTTIESKVRTYRRTHGLMVGLGLLLRSSDHTKHLETIADNKSDKTIPFYFVHEMNEGSIIWDPKENTVKIYSITSFKQPWK